SHQTLCLCLPHIWGHRQFHVNEIFLKIPTYPFYVAAPKVLDYNITVTPKDSTTVEMEFVPIAGVNRYIIRSLDPADPTFFKEDEVTSSPAEVTGLTPFTKYEFSIMSVNDAGKSQPTLPVTAKTRM
uniref:Fibronectin type-III domain-containing protein n=1 Tax=Neogobius melanostomus TaxID=47308 RepID=A0A8C6WZM7_9GOBI